MNYLANHLQNWLLSAWKLEGNSYEISSLQGTSTVQRPYIRPGKVDWTLFPIATRIYWNPASSPFIIALLMCHTFLFASDSETVYSSCDLQ